MGDVLSLIERAEQKLDRDKALEVHRKLQSDSFSLEDFRDQLREMKKIGSVEEMLGMLPKVGIFKDAAKAKIDEKELVYMDAIINSMTPRERRNHEIINGKRRRRIARGSGTSVQQVNQLLRQYVQTSRMMKTMSKSFFGKQLNKLRVPAGAGPA
jgi:signal recognition particle subunit SRP54